jgi:hypothetical protein
VANQTPAFRRGVAGRTNRSTDCVGEIVEMRGRKQAGSGLEHQAAGFQIDAFKTWRNDERERVS